LITDQFLGTFDRELTKGEVKSLFKIAALIVLISFPEFTQTHKVVVISADCTIQPACADFIHSAIVKAAGEHAECLIIELNTPGGLLKSTRVIVTDFLQAKIPIVVYVAPSGSQAASAGVFITLAAHIAAMAPGTNIGAAHPVTMQGEMNSIMNEKVTNDAAAFIRSITEKRHRNAVWAEDAVRKSLSITSAEALKLNVIDLTADNIQDLLEKIDGREVETVTGKQVLHTRNAEVINLGMTFAQKLLSLLSDPNLAYILLMLGIYGLFFELYNPGAIFPGVVGGICLILAFYSMHSLPINYAGLALILFGIILFVLEIKIISHGLLTIGGIVSLFLGSIMLIKENAFNEAMEISMGLIILIVALTAVFFLFAISMGIKAQRKKPTTGKEGLIGETATAITNLSPFGEVSVHGEIWKAESLRGDIVEGEKIQVTGIDNLLLKVDKIK
jgi:membrane-bound serine protease (ClpP class)